MVEACKCINVFENTSSLFHKLIGKFLGDRTKNVGLYCLGIVYYNLIV